MLKIIEINMCNRFIKTTKLKYENIESACLRGPNVLFLAQYIKKLDYSDGYTRIRNEVEKSECQKRSPNTTALG